LDDRLHVLVHGTLNAGVCDVLRAGVYVAPLAAMGVELRTWASFADDALNGGAPSGPIPAGDARDEASSTLWALGMTALAWADVVVLRRWHATVLACSACGTPMPSLEALGAHTAATGHLSLTPDVTLAPLIELLERHPELLAGRGVLYETDDDVLGVPDWTGLGWSARAEAGLIRRMIGLADLVTTTTPVLAARLAPHARGEVRVVRTALDPAWYAAPGGVGGEPVPDADEPPASEPPRIVYHGAPIRLRDYAVARAAVDAAAASVPGSRRIWLGAAHEPRVAALVDEALPWVEGVPAFAAALAAARPSIGVAPLVDDAYNRARSELHWLEYSLAGAATVATAFDDAGPYDPIRDGVDGLLARTPADWEGHLRALTASPALRRDLAGAARERVLREATIEARAPEWAQAYRDAATLGRAARRSARA
jgi:hypothetical protein